MHPCNKQLQHLTENSYCTAAGPHLTAGPCHLAPPLLQVEQQYISSGHLYPAFHLSYWLGLAAAANGTWSWRDITLAPPGPSTYVRWGAGQPNGSPASEACGAASFSGLAAGQAAAWGDEACSLALPFICRTMGGWRPGAAAASCCCGHHGGPERHL